MTRTTKANELAKLISDLQTERQTHLDAIAAIDETFGQFGIAAEEVGRRRGPGRPQGTKGRKKTSRVKVAKETRVTKKTRGRGRRRRGTFSNTGEESVLAFVKKEGSPNAKVVNEHWAKEGRGGKADNTLSKLVKEGKLNRVKAKGERGSRYKMA